MSRVGSNGKGGQDDRSISEIITDLSAFGHPSCRDNLTTDRTSYSRHREALAPSRAEHRPASRRASPSQSPGLSSRLTLGSGVAVGGRPKGAGLRARASASPIPVYEIDTGPPDKHPSSWERRWDMRSALLLSVVTALLLGLLSLARHECQESELIESELATGEDEAYLFV